jgi:hypothetical protein
LNFSKRPAAIKNKKTKEADYVKDIGQRNGGGLARLVLDAEKQQYDNEVDKLIIHLHILKPLRAKGNQDLFGFSSKQSFRTSSANLIG